MIAKEFSSACLAASRLRPVYAMVALVWSRRKFTTSLVLAAFRRVSMAPTIAKAIAVKMAINATTTKVVLVDGFMVRLGVLVVSF